MLASILCLGMDTRTPRVHVPDVTGSYLLAVLNITESRTVYL